MHFSFDLRFPLNSCLIRLLLVLTRFMLRSVCKRPFLIVRSEKQKRAALRIKNQPVFLRMLFDAIRMI